MQQPLQIRVKPDIAYNPGRLVEYLNSRLPGKPDVADAVVVRRSIDARQRQVYINLSVIPVLRGQQPPDFSSEIKKYEKLPADAPSAVVVGAGPAGLFAALRLIERGVRPVIVERGQDVDTRRKDLAKLNRTGAVDPDSNYCFGEGGAGAFSDGKLYTRSKKRGNVDEVLAILHAHGAQKDILVDAHPHIGSDRLPVVIANIRQTILDCGGEVHFGKRMQRLVIDNDNRVKGIMTGDGQEFEGPVILATGHSARDVYASLAAQGVELQAKGLAVGCRIEHPQELIDRIQYHNPAGRGKYLPAAEYSLLTRVDGRAVYSFCMCPGGYIIPAASHDGQSVVNGMSPANRGTKWANSGMVVEILPEDVPGEDPLRMMHLQQSIEESFAHDAAKNFEKHSNANPLSAPAQRVTDFIAEKVSSTLPPTSYAPGIHSADINALLPGFVSDRLKKGLDFFGKKHRGYVTDTAVLIGCETRTSAPVRIPRDTDSLASLSLQMLFPAGEGAGYAGGIVSAAIDGMRAADALADAIKHDDSND